MPAVWVRVARACARVRACLRVARVCLCACLCVILKDVTTGRGLGVSHANHRRFPIRKQPRGAPIAGMQTHRDPPLLFIPNQLRESPSSSQCTLVETCSSQTTCGGCVGGGCVLTMMGCETGTSTPCGRSLGWLVDWLLAWLFGWLFLGLLWLLAGLLAVVACCGCSLGWLVARWFACCGCSLGFLVVWLLVSLACFGWLRVGWMLICLGFLGAFWLH